MIKNVQPFATKFFFLCVLFLLSISPISAENSADEDTYVLSLQSALLFALDESYKVKIAGEQIKQADFSVNEAEATYYPDIQMFVEAGHEYNEPASFSDSNKTGSNANLSYDASISVRQMIYDKISMGEVDRLESVLNATTVEKNIVEEDLIENTITSYLDVLLRQRQAYALAEMLLSIRKIHSHIEGAYENGGESKAQLDYASARLSLAQSKYDSAISSYKIAVNKLESYTGRLPDFIAVEPEELSIQDYDLHFFKKLALKKNSEVLLLEHNILTSEIDHQKQKDSYLPTLDLVAEAGTSYDRGGETGSDTDASLMFQFKYDLFKGGARQARQKKAESKVRELNYQKEDLFREITRDVKEIYREISGLKQNFKSKLLEIKSYLSLRDINKKSLEIGEVDHFKSIENEENIAKSLMDSYEMELDIYKKSYSLLKIIGSLKKNKFCESC